MSFSSEDEPMYMYKYLILFKKSTVLFMGTAIDVMLVIIIPLLIKKLN